MNSSFITDWWKERRPSVSRCPPTILQQTLQGIDINKPIIQGRVFKQFRSESGFNKRYFALYPGVLVYYKHERDYRRDLRKGLRNCRMLKLNGLYLTKPEKPPAPNCKHCFYLHLPDSFNQRQHMLLVVKTRKLKKLWITYLQAQNPDLRPPSKKSNGVCVTGHLTTKSNDGKSDLVKNMDTSQVVGKDKEVPKLNKSVSF